MNPTIDQSGNGNHLVIAYAYRKSPMLRQSNRRPYIRVQHIEVGMVRRNIPRRIKRELPKSMRSLTLIQLARLLPGLVAKHFPKHANPLTYQIV